MRNLRLWLTLKVAQLCRVPVKVRDTWHGGSLGTSLD